MIIDLLLHIKLPNLLGKVTGEQLLLYCCKLQLLLYLDWVIFCYNHSICNTKLSSWHISLKTCMLILTTLKTCMLILKTLKDWDKEKNFHWPGIDAIFAQKEFWQTVVDCSVPRQGSGSRPGWPSLHVSVHCSWNCCLYGWDMETLRDH